MKLLSANSAYLCDLCVKYNREKYLTQRYAEFAEKIFDFSKIEQEKVPDLRYRSALCS